MLGSAKGVLKDTSNIKVINIDELEKWNKIINEFSMIDTYYTVGYVKSFMLHGDGMPFLLYYSDNNISAMNVVMLRDINDLDYLKMHDGEKQYDLSTPYGYGGFVLKGKVRHESIKLLNDSYVEFCMNNHIVSEVVRFHPVINNAEMLSELYDIVKLGNTITMDLESEDTIWQSLTSKNRNMIRKAVKNGVKINYGFSKDLFGVFQCMYNDTMDRDNARDYYYFKDEFYSTLLNECHDDIQIFFAEYEGEKISMAIILRRNNQMHYHLSASQFAYRHLAPTNLLLWEAAKWGCNNGCKTFHLGGGLGGSATDSLYKFKKSFNKNHECSFYLGKKIFDQTIYDELVERAKENGALNPAFFPLYRGIC